MIPTLEVFTQFQENIVIPISKELDELQKISSGKDFLIRMERINIKIQEANIIYLRDEDEDKDIIEIFGKFESEFNKIRKTCIDKKIKLICSNINNLISIFEEIKTKTETIWLDVHPKHVMQTTLIQKTTLLPFNLIHLIDDYIGKTAIDFEREHEKQCDAAYRTILTACSLQVIPTSDFFNQNIELIEDSDVPSAKLKRIVSILNTDPTTSKISCLNLSEMRITRLPLGLKLPNLTTVNLSGNPKLENVDDFLKSLNEKGTLEKSLIVLNLSDTGLDSTPGTIASLCQLKSLDLSKNNIKEERSQKTSLLLKF